MDRSGRIKEILDYNITIDLNQRINRNRALFFLAVFSLMIVVAGYYAGERWFWVSNRTFYENRLDTVREMMRRYPGSNDLRAEMAMTEYLNGNVAKSVGLLRDIIAGEPGNGTAILYLGLIQCEQQAYQESARLLTRYLKTHQGLESRLALLYLGRDCLALGQYDQAVLNLAEAVRRDPGNPVAYYYLGQAYEKLPDSKKAMESYEKALSIAGNYTEADMALRTLVKGMSARKQ